MGRLLLLLLLSGAALWAVERRRRASHPVAPGLHEEVDLAHEQPFELYHNALSLCSMKVRVCLAELRVPYASHPIDLIETGAYENIRPRFLAVNPAGTVPVLVHEGHPVYESHEQIRYAALHAPPGAPSLVPDDPALQEEMQRWIDRSSLTDDPLEHGDESAGNAVPGLTVPIFAAMIERIPAWRIVEGLLFHYDRRRPLLFLSLKLRGLERLPRMRMFMRLLARSREQMHRHLDALEAQLERSGGPWILGESLTLADVSWLAIFERLAQVDALPVFCAPARRPACARYVERWTSRASYREAILGHTHPTIAYGTGRLSRAKADSPALREALDGPPPHGRPDDRSTREGSAAAV